MSESFIVGMDDSARAALERRARQQGRFRRFFLATELDCGTAWGVELRVGTFRSVVQLRGRDRSYKSLAAARRKLAAEIRGAEFRRRSRLRRNKVRHFGTGKTYQFFR